VEAPAVAGRTGVAGDARGRDDRPVASGRTAVVVGDAEDVSPPGREGVGGVAVEADAGVVVVGQAVAVGVIGTLVGTTVGHLLGSMGKDQAEKRADKNLALILEKLQKGHELNGKL